MLNKNFQLSLPGKIQIKSEFKPAGDQEKAISELTKGLEENEKHQVLLGITGSGKTFTMANVIAKWGKPTLILAHNKTLAAQLYSEFSALFPDNAVHYFVSYYDYYQPEAYIPTSDVYIEKDAQINEEIDRLRHAATNSLLSRRDVIIVASVSCIFGIGSPEFYLGLSIHLDVNAEIDRDIFLKRLVEIQYERNDYDFSRGTFRVRGDVVEVFPADANRIAFRIQWFGDEIESITEIDPLLGKSGKKLDFCDIFPSSHYVIPKENMDNSLNAIREELRISIQNFKNEMKLIEAQRIEMRTSNDLERMETIGYCNGIENYSRFFDGRIPGEPPATLLDYFPDDFLMFIDESHQTIPQVRAMYKGDYSRKRNLVDFGFRLPSALDNRPLKFPEFESRLNKVIYVSATPSQYELEQSAGVVVEQIVRPTGLLDPKIEVRKTEHQLDDLLHEINKRVANSEKVLVVTLTKRMSEELTDYYEEIGVRVQYLHSGISTFDRMTLLHDFRDNKFDVLVGINLLREGLDLPEVSLVAILDADVEGFLRSSTSLFQICGRASRNSSGMVIMYADKVTRSMKEVIDETLRRRIIQKEFNKKNNITPVTIIKKVQDMDLMIGRKPKRESETKPQLFKDPKEFDRLIKALHKKMKKHAGNLEFEQAASIRDQIRELEKLALFTP